MASAPGVASHWRQFGCTVWYRPHMTDGTQRVEDTQATQQVWFGRVGGNVFN